MSSNSPTIQTPKLKTSESTYGSQQSKSQAETEALINQYNLMTPQQRAASSLSIGSLGGLAGISQIQMPHQNYGMNQSTNQPSSPILKSTQTIPSIQGVSPLLQSPFQHLTQQQQPMSLSPKLLQQQLQLQQAQMQQQTQQVGS